MKFITRPAVGRLLNGLVGGIVSGASVFPSIYLYKNYSWDLFLCLFIISITAHILTFPIQMRISNKYAAPEPKI